MARTRQRYAREASKAFHANQKCYLVLKITDGPCHAEIQEDWCEQYADHRSILAESFKIAGMEGESVVRSERHGCIKMEEASFSEGSLCRPLIKPTAIPSLHSYLWHFAGTLVPSGEITSRRVAFCEYNSRSRSGFVIITFDGRLLPEFYRVFPQFLQDVRVFKAREYDWLLNNW